MSKSHSVQCANAQLQLAYIEESIGQIAFYVIDAVHFSLDVTLDVGDEGHKV